MISAGLFSIRSTTLIGSRMASPNTTSVLAVMSTVTSANSMKLIGRPRKLPRRTACELVPKRVKSAKFSSSAAKYATTSAATPSISANVCAVVSSRVDRLSVNARQPAWLSIHAASANITTYTAGPQKSMKRRTRSMPCKNSNCCSSHIVMKHTHPSPERPSQPVPSAACVPGRIASTRISRACEPSQVCTPYQTMPTPARISAGRLAPNTPKLSRASTGYGAPVFSPIMPMELSSTLTMRMPTSIDSRICQPARPRKNSPAANT